MSVRAKHGLALIVVAALMGCPSGGSGSSGVDGKNGTNGKDGTNGMNGMNGMDGAAGEPGAAGMTGPAGPAGDAGANGKDGTDGLLIIETAAVDKPGTTDDKDVSIRFSRNPTPEAIAAATVSFRRSFRNATKLVATTAGGECPGGTCYTNVAGAKQVALTGDTPSTSYLEVGSTFVLLFDADIENDGVDRLGAWISGLFRTSNAFSVRQVPIGTGAVLSPRAFQFTAKVQVPIAQFDAMGVNLGRTLILPAYTVLDINGNGNEMAVLVLNDGAGATSQAEPKGVAYTQASIITDVAKENGSFAVGSKLRLCFDMPMDKLSTELAIETRLSAMPNWTNGTGPLKISVLQVAANAACFDVTIQNAAVDMMPIGRVDTLTLAPWDVTSAQGITNTTKPIVFQIFEAKAPTILSIVGKPVADTLRIRLQGGYPTTRPDNNTLIGDDALDVVFSEAMNVSTVQTELALKVNTLVTGATGTDIVDLGSNTFGYTLKPTDTIAIAGSTLTYGELNSMTVADLQGVKLASSQTPTATKSDFIVPPVLTAKAVGTPGEGDTLGIVLGSGAKREDDIIEAGDTLVFTFSKSMLASRVQPVLAKLITSGVVTGGTRSSPFSAVASASVIASQTVVPNDTYSYTLVGNQKFTITAGVFQFAAISEAPPMTLITDIEGLHLLPNQKVAVGTAFFDPPVPPKLLTVTAARVDNACGDGVLGPDDTVTFTFSEPLDSSAVAGVTANIATVLTSALSSGSVTVGDIVSSADTVFTATLPASARLATGAAKRFVLDPFNVVDTQGVVAVDAAAVTASLAPTDVLSVALTLGNQFVIGDGLFEGGDQVIITFSCKMDKFETLSSVQEAVDKLMKDGTAKVTTTGPGAQMVYTAEVLPGRSFAAPGPQTLNIQNVVTDDGTTLTLLMGPYPLPFDDSPTADVTFTVVGTTLTADTAVFRAAAAVKSGTWFLSGFSTQLARVRADLPIVFSASP